MNCGPRYRGQHTVAHKFFREVLPFPVGPTLLILNDAKFRTGFHCVNKVIGCKIGAALVSNTRARPRSCVPHPPKMLDLGRGRHILNKLWLTVGTSRAPF
jgi:hypothetical protein